jgi:hypothetical protein
MRIVSASYALFLKDLAVQRQTYLQNRFLSKPRERKIVAIQRPWPVANLVELVTAVLHLGVHG